MNMLLHDLIFKAARSTPDACAIVYKGSTTTYQELYELSLTQSAAFCGAGLQPNDRVAVLLPKQLETVSSIIAVNHAAGVFVPLIRY